eukprot:4724743-Heterocapsa_arctica.AAC.1
MAQVRPVPLKAPQAPEVLHYCSPPEDRDGTLGTSGTPAAAAAEPAHKPAGSPAEEGRHVDYCRAVKRKFGGTERLRWG